MRLQVFDVEHGACALLTDDLGRHVMIDCGHHSKLNWYPGDALRSANITSIEALVVTNYDEDHVSGIENLFRHVHVPKIYRNMSVSPQKIRQLKTEDGMGRGIEFLVNKLTEWSAPSSGVSYDQIGLSDVTFQAYGNSLSQFSDENNLSLAVKVTAKGINFLFTGDLEVAGWRSLLQHAQFREDLKNIDVFFASHHGRESGCCAEVFEICTPTFIVISDKAKGYQTQETTDWYRNRATGGAVSWDPKKRTVLTTRNDGDFQFEILDSGYNVLKF